MGTTSKNILLGAALMASLAPMGTAQAQTVLDGGYIKEHTKTQRVVPYPHIREADVMWYRRVWRDIDLREKINQPLYYPVEPINDRKSLFDVIIQGLTVDGSITAYDAGIDGWQDEFKKPLLPEEVQSMLVRMDTSYTENLTTGDLEPVVQEIRVSSENVKKYRIKEDWHFDRQRSVMDIRIIGISPLKEKLDADGALVGYTPLFWLYFPELRYVLVNWEVFNRGNDSERRSFDHLFWTRQFNSQIVKMSNSYDRPINVYKTGMDALLEAEELKQNLFEFEHDLWNF
ncbi:MAG TPA: gliding motility protein GldN [Flavobacteriales bacterium]